MGPIYTIDMIKINNKNGGGIDITEDILSKLKERYQDTDNNKFFDEDIIIENSDDELTQ